MAQQDVIIDFFVNDAQLESAIDTLAQIGAVDKEVANSFKATTAEINKQAQSIKNTSTAIKGPIQSIDQLDKKTKQFVKDFVEGFQEGINEELARAKPELDALRKKLEETGATGKTSTGSLRQELRGLTEEIARAKATGGPIDPAMLQRAGALKDAIADANKEISNTGSDTRNIDNVVGSLSALAGGYSAVIGVTSLFGNENEDLQKVLLKVNATMAAATGIQQFANAVTKEGALTKLADATATGTQIAVQKLYTIVTGRATAATVAFKVALAATGVGLLIVGLLALNEVLKDTTSDLEAATDAIDAQNAALESQTAFIERNLTIELARAEAIGAAESELTRIRGRSLQAQVAALEASNAVLINQRNQVRETSEEWFKLNDQIDKNVEAVRGINTSIIVESLNLEKQLADEKKAADEKRLQKAKENHEKELQLAREARAREFQDFKAAQELKVLAAKDGSEDQLKAKQDLLRAELAIELENDKLTTNQKKVLIQQFFKDRLQLEKDFNKANNEQQLSDIASDLNTELQQINLSNERKLELTESLLDVQAALEIAAANGNAAKIQEIEAKKNLAILQARKDSLIEAANFEASLSQATSGPQQRALARVAQDEKQKLDVRINAINQLENIDEESISRRLALNQELFAKGLISEKEFRLAEAQLIDERNKVWEDAEIKRADLTERENERIKQSNIEMIENAISIFSEVSSVLDSLFSLQSERESQQIEEQKQKLKDLKEAGAITEKEAITRQKRIEAEERKAKQQQAQREKAIAVFNALLAIPQAFLQGVKSAPPPLGQILGAINAALAAAQAAIIIARPIPKFSKGKKNMYEGPGIIGEAGAELIQRADGSMHIATKPTLIYVGKKDKIFTHSETRMMLPTVDKSVMKKEKPEKLNYDKLAAAIIKGYKPTPGTTINIDKEFISESVSNGLLKTNYFDRYYSSK